MAEQQPVPRAGGSIVRQSDIEPYTALRWVSKMFKGASIFLAVALIGEFIAAIRQQGGGVLPILLGELARTAVFAVVLWGAGDLVRLFIQLGNDIRAERILLARLVYRTPARIEGAESPTHERHGASMLDPTGLLDTGDIREDEAARRSLGTADSSRG